MNTLKRKNMMAAYDGFAGAQTVKAVLEQIPPELFDRLTGKELGMVMSAVNAAYHNGKASAGIEIVDDCVWYNGKLIPTAALSAIEIKEKMSREEVKAKIPQFNHTRVWTEYTYTLNYSEKF